MNSFKAIVSATFVVALSFVLASCVTESTPSGEELEQKSLDAWIKLHKPELEVNRQKDGYYVEILAWGDEGEPASGNDIGTDPTMDQDTCWVYTDLVARGLSGTVCLTRDHIMADMCGTFSYDTHYVPYFIYGGNSNVGIIEGSYKALRNEITLGEEYINKYWPGKSTTFKMRKGAKVRLYLPSVLAYNETGTTAEGGYEGQYSLSANTSMIMEMDIKGVVRNPSDKELEMVESYKTGLAGWKWEQATKSESESSSSSESESEKKEDTKLEGLYYSLDYNPKSDNPTSHIYVSPEKKSGSNPYKDTKRYTSMEELDRKINEVLLKRFGEGLDAASRNDKTKVTHTGKANVWYIGRFLDGFIFDTHIDEVKALISDEKEAGGAVFSYRPSDDDGVEEDSKSAIGAWYYCISQMHYGSYGTILTTSGYAYGASGISGTTTTSSSSANDAMYNYYNYYNYYASMYNYYDLYNYYNYNSYYYNYNYTASDTTTTVTTIIETEILPYTPLVFTVFVEKKE